jgi:hypothetical protein
MLKTDSSLRYSPVEQHRQAVPTAANALGRELVVQKAATDAEIEAGLNGQSQPNDARAPKAVEGVAEQPPLSTVCLAEPGPDGVSTKIVAPKSCSAAEETDGTTTCVGIPARR